MDRRVLLSIGLVAAAAGYAVLTGAAATVVLRIFGPHLDGLNGQAATVAAAIKGIRGVADLKVQPQVLVPQLSVRFVPERAQLVGVSPGDVRRAATTLVQGTKVGEVYEDQKVLDVVVRGAPGVRDNIEAARRGRAAFADSRDRACDGARAAAGGASGGRAGHEIEHPMAVVILGGLLTSTALNLLLLPALYERWGRGAAAN